MIDESGIPNDQLFSKLIVLGPVLLRNALLGNQVFALRLINGFPLQLFSKLIVLAHDAMRSQAIRCLAKG